MISIEVITVFLVLLLVWLGILTFIVFDLIRQVADLNTYRIRLQAIFNGVTESIKDETWP